MATFALMLLGIAVQQNDPPRDKVWGGGLIEETIEVDVFVAGGGSAGTSAAIAAARNGAKTLIVNGRSVLGGNSGSEVRVGMVGACGPRSGVKNALLMECREGGIVEEYILDNTVNNPASVPEFFSLELLTMIKAEPNIILLQDTWLVSVDTVVSSSGVKQIVSATCENQMTQRRYFVKAKTFIDATGDGRLGAEAGAEWIQGREGPAEYNESLAVGFGPDHETEGTSLIYHVVDNKQPTPFTSPFWAAKFNESQFQYRSVSGTSGGYWWTEVSYPYNTITDGENITNELLEDMFGIWDYIKNSGNHPESKDMMIDWFGFVGGKREGRRFVGQFVASQNDIMKDPNAEPPQAPTMFWDRVAYAGWDFDLHDPMGMRDPTHPPYRHFKTPYVYSTALGSLIAKDVTNLFFAGRLASFSHIVYGSQRVMKSCAVMGQAAGTAAAFSVTKNIDPITIRSSPENVWSIQQQLLRDDAFIIGMINEDPRDHARNATITATAEMTGNGTNDGRAVNIISGQTRAIVATGGVPEGQGVAGPNRWMSQGLPATISMSLQQTTAIAQAQLIFDTGMHMPLRQNYVSSKPITALLPTESVRDYFIEGLDSSGAWVMLCNVTDNYQRRRVHNLPCPPPHQKPNPLPPVPTPPVANSVFVQSCDAQSATQQWTFDAGAVRGHNASGAEVCLSVSENTFATGGEVQAVIATPCDGSLWQSWSWNASTQGSFLKAAKQINCTVHTDNSTCQCAHITACTACHSENTVFPGSSVELWPCHSDSADVSWSMLQVATGANKPGLTGLLLTGGLCLDTKETISGPESTSTPTPTLSSIPTDGVAGVASPPRKQRDRNTPAQSPPVSVSAVRVTVTATNGIANAHINEIRLYDAKGVDPFPDRV
eukprot:m.258359 g.258359  ORF g.258359 m.258359 type:complete len:885 (+) comp36477_c0_seq1:156-2810(+)